jgi:drug/metabolite transporter (DMT)-like permease
MREKRIVNWVVFILLCIIWGSSFIIMKVSTKELDGMEVGAIRIFAAGLVFLPFAIFHMKSIPAKKLPLLILSGLLGNLFPAFLFAIAIEKKVNSSFAGILNSLTPLFVMIIAVLFFRARIQASKVIGVLIGFIGLTVLSLSKGGISLENFAFTLMILVATIMYGLNVNIVSHYLKDLDPVKMATVSLAFMTIPAGFVIWQENVVSMAVNDESTRWSIAAAALLGIVGSAFATALFYLLIKRAGGLFASMVTYGIPVVSILWGLRAGEDVTLIQVICLAVILAGVYITNRK